MKKSSLTRSISGKFTALFLALLITASGHAELPTLGDPTQQNFTPFNEYLMGKQFYLTLKANVPFIDDLEVNDFVTNLGKTLVSYSDFPDKQFKFFVIKINSINAFAGPDAYLGFHTGLILAAKNESEFAGVMAHEIAHVTQRHLARALTDSSSSPAAMFATILAGILLASQNPDAGAALIYGGQAALIQSQINFTRANEHEADRIGINILKNAQINPEGMASFFETLLKYADANNILSQIEYLRTHPLNSTRVAEARNRINTENRELRSDSLDFQFTKARVLVQTHTNPEQLLTQLEQRENTDSVSEYTLGLAYIRNRKPQQAIKTLTALTHKESHPWVKLALSDAYSASNQAEPAMKILQSLHTLYPNYLPVSIRLARALIDDKQNIEAINLLNQLLRSQKKPVIYSTLAKAYFAEKNISLALEATSYEYELEGYIKQAAQQIENALQQENLKPLTVQRLQARKQVLMEQVLKESKL